MFRAILWACLALVSLLFFLPFPLLIASQAAAAGDLDASFGTGGKVTTNFGGTEEAWKCGSPERRKDRCEWVL